MRREIMSNKKNRIVLEAVLTPRDLTNVQKKEYASKLELPENDQDDLLFMSAILVSTGTNKNGATFLGSELIKAKDTIALKPLDIEHEEDKIIGHICSSMYMDHEGNVLDHEKMYAELASKDEAKATAAEGSFDEMDMDIGIVTVVYKDRFKQIAEELELGKWKVSMECYYDDFDLKVGDLIIPRGSVQAHQAYISEMNLSDAVRLTIAGKEAGTHKVSRILRGVKFCGCGIVENPANPRSVVLEAAKDYTQRVMDREGIDAGLKAAATIAVEVQDGITTSPLSEDKVDDEVVQIGRAGYMLLEDGEKVIKDSFTSDYNMAQQDAIRRTSLSHKAGEDKTFTVIEMNSMFSSRENMSLNESSEAVLYKTNDVGTVNEIVTITNSKEQAQIANRWGPADNTSGICVSFKKYLFEKQPNHGRIIATHWCSQFNAPCPVLGADAQDPTCLRNRYSRNTPEREIHDKNYVVTPYSPTSSVEDTIQLSSDEQPTNPPLDKQILQNDLEGTPMPESRVVDSNVERVDPEPQTQRVSPENTETIPADPIEPKEGVTEYNPVTDFPVQLANTREERASLPNSAFGLPEKRMWPLHRPALVKNMISIYPKIATKMPSVSKRRELYRNIVFAALKYGIDSKQFEKDAPFKLKAGKDFDGDYGVPRLKLFPLASREQVLAAMSRMTLVKADISAEEKERLIINILRAAKKFNINSDRFREKFFGPGDQ